MHIYSQQINFISVWSEIMSLKSDRLEIGLSVHSKLELKRLRQGRLKPQFNGDLVYKLKKIVVTNNFSVQFMEMISQYKNGFNINVLQLTECLVVNPITVGSFVFLFNCMPAGWTSDSMMLLT